MLERRKQEHTDGMGRMPAIAPLANPYVPYQAENPAQYELRKGIVRGTLYPGLDLPFMGMTNKSPLPMTSLSELQALGFAIQELTLYLDTHREDREALELYRLYQQKYIAQEKEYVKKYGPLNHQDATVHGEYEWLSDPWPWEYSANKEG